MLASTDKETSLRLRQKVKRDNLTAFYRHLDVAGNLDLIILHRFKVTTDTKKRSDSFRVLQW